VAESPFPTSELVARLVRAETACVVDWVGAMAALAGNPLRAEVVRFGGTTACVCGAIPAEIWNRAFGMSTADAARIPEIVELYRARGAAPLFDLDPYSVEPFYAGPTVLADLAAHGLYQASFHQLLYGVPTEDVPATSSGVEIREVGPEQADDFGRVYETVWGGAAAIRVLLGQPAFRCFLAYVDGQAAALGVLHVRDGAGSMANGLTDPRFRNRGCQTALLHRRLAEAARAGCDLVVSQCRPGSQSQRNQLRAGFRIVGSKVWWAARPELSAD
jgi:GNAT superfamily N-acetyltransferase